MKTCLRLLLLAALAASCKIMTETDRINASLPALSAEELLAAGNKRFEEKKYDRARLYHRFLYENFPNSPQAVEALLRMADAYALEVGIENKIEARQRFADFYSRFPQAPQAEYALFMQGKLSLALKPHPDKDPADVNQAMVNFNRYLQIFPDGPHAEEARAGLTTCRQILAEHEYNVAWFYYKRKSFRATIARLEFLQRSFPDYSKMGKVYLLFGWTYRDLGDEEAALEYFGMAEAAGVEVTKS
jgi:outer membrane protein assembly factor BamD